ncbi:hypothetical protein D3C74_501130 [compost metagenome]
MPMARVKATEQAEKITVQTKICMKGPWMPGSVMMRTKFFQPTLTTKPGAMPLPTK